MNDSLKSTLEWYRDLILILSANTNKFKYFNSNKSFKLTINKLIEDGGAKAQTAINSLSYVPDNIKSINDLLSSVICNLRMTVNTDYNLETRNNAIILANEFITKLINFINISINDNKIIDNINQRNRVEKAIIEFNNSISEQHSRLSTVYCKVGHEFIALPNHPKFKDILVCPYCSFQSMTLNDIIENKKIKG